MSVELEDQILERKEFMERDKSGYILKEQQLKSIKENFIKKKGNNKIDLYELISALKKFGINYNEDNFDNDGGYFGMNIPKNIYNY